jgi:non-homologous end joining protein Ku
VLRYADEVPQGAELFQRYPRRAEDLIELATTLIEKKTAPSSPRNSMTATSMRCTA